MAKKSIAAGKEEISNSGCVGFCGMCASKVSNAEIDAAGKRAESIVSLTSS